jgi:methyl-accepting chemotaxis protein
MNFPSLRLPSLATGSAYWLALREFFAYHGVWAPGVRLLRRMPVRNKLLLVLAIVAAPLLPLTWMTIQSQNHLVVDTTQRLTELRLAGAIAEMVTALGKGGLGNDADNGAGGDPAKVAAAWIQVQQAYALAADAGLPLQQAWERNQAELSQVVQDRAQSAEARHDSQRDAVEALLRLRKSLAEVAAGHANTDAELDATTTLALELLPGLQIELGRLSVQLSRAAALVPHLAASDRYATLLALSGRLEHARYLAEQCVQRLQKARLAPAGGQAEWTEVPRFLEGVRVQVAQLDPEAPVQALQTEYASARERVQRLRLDHYARAEQGLQRQLAAASQERLWVVGLLLAAIGLASYLLFCFFLVMRGGLSQLNHQMALLAQGDLSARPSPVGGDEVAAAMRAMNASLVRLSDLLASVRTGVSGVNQATQQVATGNAELTLRNRDNAGSVSAVVDGVSRYAEQLQACGRQVESVVHNVQGLRLESARNRQQMQRLRERMAQLRSKSREIGEIVTLIDSIAFRTNILALNASVEASKAGEAGRGFAVVAQEVRSLALRGAESARRIGDIVTRSTEDIELSGDLAEATGLALAAADERIDSIHLAMDDVAGLTRSGEQESAAILQQLTVIRNSTDHSLQLVEQLATASTALRTQGQRLAHKIGQFRLG